MAPGLNHVVEFSRLSSLVHDSMNRVGFMAHGGAWGAEQRGDAKYAGGTSSFSFNSWFCYHMFAVYSVVTWLWPGLNGQGLDLDCCV